MFEYSKLSSKIRSYVRKIFYAFKLFFESKKLKKKFSKIRTHVRKKFKADKTSFRGPNWLKFGSVKYS